MSFDFFLPCPRGLEAPLAAELAEIASQHLNGAAFTAGAQEIFRQLSTGLGSQSVKFGGMMF